MEIEPGVYALLLMAIAIGLLVILYYWAETIVRRCPHTWVKCRSCGKVIKRWQNTGYGRWVGERKVWNKKTAANT